MDPAPIAIMTRTFANGEVNPSAGIIGAIIAEVVIIATVEAPIAVFNSAAMMNGRNTPTPSPSKDALRVGNTLGNPFQGVLLLFLRDQGHGKKYTKDQGDNRVTDEGEEHLHSAVTKGCAREITDGF